MSQQITTFERFSISAASALWIGCRNRQEDSAAICSRSASTGQPCFLAILADGVGGLADGAKVSKLLIKSYEKQFKKKQVIDLTSFLAETNEQLRLKKKAGSIDIDAGSTLIALSVTSERICWLNVGDSLLYRRRHKHLQKLNTAHTLGNEIDKQLRNHEISWEEAAAQEDNRDILTSVISGTAINEVEFQTEAPLLGDRYIIASDGLQPLIDHHWGNLLDELEDTPPSQTCDVLIQRLKSLQAPLQDNVSIIVIDITQPINTTTSNSIFKSCLQILRQLLIPMRQER